MTKFILLAGLIGNACAQTDANIYGSLVGQRVVGNETYVTISAARGDKDAATSRDEIAKNMTFAQIIEAQKLAREWKPFTRPLR